MYRSESTPDDLLLAVRVDTVPMEEEEHRPAQPPIRALAVYQKVPFGLTFAALFLFVSGLALLGGRGTGIALFHGAATVGTRITEDGMKHEQLQLVRPLGTPVAAFFEVFGE